MRGDLLMAEWKDQLFREFPQVTIETACITGLITEVLPKMAKEPTYSLIIMGSNGLSKKDSPLFGSTTSQIATKSRIPVIAIPYNIVNYQTHKAALLTNFKEDELESLKDFNTLIGSIAELDIIHVYQNSDDVAAVELQIENWSAKIQALVPLTKINTVLKPLNYSVKALDSIAEVVNNTIEEYKYDIVIVTKTRKSFFDRWFSRSISKEIIFELEAATYFDNN